MARFSTFGTLIVPHTSLSISGEAKITIHEYRWLQGGTPEDHGRGLYTFETTNSFSRDASFSPRLFPDVLNGLRRMFDDRVVDYLDIEDIGRVPCRISSFRSQHEGSIDGGATAQISFLEQEGHRFLAATAKAKSSASLQAATDAWTFTVEKYRPPVETDLQKLDIKSPQKRAFDIFDRVTDAANAVLGYRDQALLFGELLASKIQSLTGVLRDARSTSWLDDPMNYPVLYALHDLASAAIAMASEPEDDRGAPRRYKVQQLSTVAQVSSAIYGSTDRAGDLLALNNFQDAMRIKAGSSVVYIPAAA